MFSVRYNATVTSRMKKKLDENCTEFNMNPNSSTISQTEHNNFFLAIPYIRFLLKERLRGRRRFKNIFNKEVEMGNLEGRITT